jgi:hypothetical protein
VRNGGGRFDNLCVYLCHDGVSLTRGVSLHQVAFKNCFLLPDITIFKVVLPIHSSVF